MVQDNGYSFELHPRDVLLSDGSRQCLDYDESNATMSQLKSVENYTEKWPYFMVEIPGESQILKQSDLESKSRSLAASEELLEEKMADMDLKKDVFYSKKPISWKESKSVVAKFYVNPEFKLNQTTEIVGIMDKRLDYPVIHVILYRDVSITDYEREYFFWRGKNIDQSSQIYAATEKRNDDITKQDGVEHCAQARNLLIEWLSESIFSGDKFRAEYFLYWLVSRVYDRREDIVTGPISVKYTDCPDNIGSSVEKLLSLLVDRLVRIPLSLEILNNHRFLPKVEIETEDNLELGESIFELYRGQLKAGALQLARNSYLLLDQTQLKTGKLHSLGIENLAVLNQAITSYGLRYPMERLKTAEDKDDENYQNLFGNGIFNELDANIMVFTAGAPRKKAKNSADEKNLLDMDASIEFSWPKSAQPKHVDKVDQTRLELFRSFLSVVKSKSNKYQVPDDLTEKIVDDFVEMRKDKSLNMCQWTLLRFLDIARLHCISELRTELTWDDWEHAKSKEILRMTKYV